MVKLNGFYSDKNVSFWKHKTRLQKRQIWRISV